MTTQSHNFLLMRFDGYREPVSVAFLNRVDESSCGLSGPLGFIKKTVCMLSTAGSTANVRRHPLTVRTSFRGGAQDNSASDILDRFFGKPRPTVCVIR
jgi:hypothetical protein